jgi:hypothetical protein
MRVQGSVLHDPELIEGKCKKYLKAIKRKKKIDLEAIGSQQNNSLLDLLRCQSRAMTGSCKDHEAKYSKCHSSVMGTGLYNGRKNCGEELEKFFGCIVGGGKDEQEEPMNQV